MVSSSEQVSTAPRVQAVGRVVGACGIALLCCALLVAKGAALDDARPELPPAPSPSLSSGLPWKGRLLRAVRLRVSAALRPVAEYAGSGNFYGTAELVGLLERTAHGLHARWPDTQLAVGELSGPRGGKLRGHRSHQSGRDVDIAFLMHDARGRALRMHGFITFRSDGSAVRVRQPLYFDQRSWSSPGATCWASWWRATGRAAQSSTPSRT